jgi:L-asparagine oxygenase
MAMQGMAMQSVSTDVQVVDCRGFDEATINLFLAPGPNPYQETEEFLFDCEMR